jgi:FtsH-binding integral membrane protein
VTNEDPSTQPSTHDLPPHRADGIVEPWARPVGAAVTGALALALLALAGFYVYELGIGASDSPVRVVMSVVLFLVFAVAYAAMSRAWLRGLTWAATPTLVTGALLVPTAWSVIQAGQLVPGLVVAVIAVAGVVVGWKGRSVPR